MKAIPSEMSRGELKRQSYLKAIASDSEAVTDRLEVLSRLSEKVYDIIFKEIEIPGLGGCETSKKIREKGSSQPYIIAMSAHDETEIAALVDECQMNDYIAKPVSKDPRKKALARYPSAINES